MQFLLFAQCFQKASFPDVSKGVIVWEWVKADIRPESRHRKKALVENCRTDKLMFRAINDLRQKKNQSNFNIDTGLMLTYFYCRIYNSNKMRENDKHYNCFTVQDNLLPKQHNFRHVTNSN